MVLDTVGLNVRESLPKLTRRRGSSSLSDPPNLVPLLTNYHRVTLLFSINFGVLTNRGACCVANRHENWWNFSFSPSFILGAV